MRVTSLAIIVVTGLLGGGCHQTARPPESAGKTQAQAEPQSASVQAPPVQAAPAATAEKTEVKPAPAPETGRQISLFDGKTLGQWKVTDFGGQGEVSVKDGAIHMATGSYMTGITWTGPVIRMNYEITLEAMRVEGSDFFCGLTFPVGEKPCTLILGGWGGSLCGLSSIDHFDASENSTTRMISFENGKWYRVRLRVVPNRIQAWLNDEDLVDADITDKNIDIRIEVEASKPLGIATWNTAGAVRNIKLKKLPDDAP
ncbi:MAG: DUF1080 domain-containing protein [Planctomycetes bacterium]|nr:DUF1080 domain-containing protein [Planctomycetota bacterium]